MKMPTTQTENGLYEYDNTTYYVENIENMNNGIEEYNPPTEDDFSEYLWMENEEEFDKEVMQRLEEEALMEQCIEAMLADETSDNHLNHSTSNSEPTNDVSCLINNLKLDSAEVVKGSNLNPLAAEFIPGTARTTPQAVGGSS